MTTQMDELKTEFAKVKESSDQVRKGIFARYNEFTKNIDLKYSELQQEVAELRDLMRARK